MAKKKRNKDNDSININVGSLKKKIKNKSKRATTYIKDNKKVISNVVALFLVLGLMFAAFDIRAQTYELPRLDQQAEAFVANNLINQLASQIEINQPTLPEQDRIRLARQQFEEQRSANSGQIDEQIFRTAEQLKNEFRNPNGETYLIGIDPYYYWQLTQQYNNTGYIYDEVLEDGTFKDNFQLAPVGRERSYQELHPIFVNWAHTLLGGFTGWSLYQVFFFMPALVAMLTVIPAFFIGRRFGGNLAGFLAGGIVAIHQGFVGRSVGGFSSTDSYNILFPLFILWMIIEAFSAKSNWSKLVLGSLAGLAMGVFSSVWNGWSFTFFIVMTVLLGYIGYLIALRLKGPIIKFLNDTFDELGLHLSYEYELSDLTKLTAWKGVLPTIITSIGVIIATIISIVLLRGVGTLLSIPSNLLGRIGIQDTVGTSLWPNVLTTVAELGLVPIPTMIRSIGGPLLFAFAFIGVMLTLLPANKKWNLLNWSVAGFGLFSLLVIMTSLTNIFANIIGTQPGNILTAFLILPVVWGVVANLINDNKDLNIPFALFLSVWFATSMFAYTQGNRFLLLVVPVFALAIAYFTARIIKIIQNIVAHYKEKTFVKDIHKIFAIGLFLIILIVPLNGVVQNGYAAAEQRTPQMNDAWYDAQTRISEETDEDGIITSWWDFGHWFKEVADRRVTFDGATQNTPMAHWVGKALLTDNEDEAKGILRMLNCGSSRGFEVLHEEMTGKSANDINGVEFLNAKNVLDEAMLLSREDAQVLYEENNATNVSRVLNYTHCDAPQSIFITSGDMVGKASVWGYFGSWDFDRSLARSLRNEGLATAVTTLQQAGIESERAQRIAGEARTLTERQSREWISERPQYLTRQAIDCEVDGEELVCELGIVIQETPQFRVEIAGAVINLSNASQTTFQTLTRNRANNLIMDRGVLGASGVVINGERTDLGGQDFPFDISVIGENDSYQGIVATPALARSVFTDLYFWDGANTESFDKIIEETSSITGTRVVVWDVDY